jgi:hypothetical protein
VNLAEGNGFDLHGWDRTLFTTEAWRHGENHYKKNL